MLRQRFVPRVQVKAKLSSAPADTKLPVLFCTSVLSLISVSRDRLLVALVRPGSGVVLGFCLRSRGAYPFFEPRGHGLVTQGQTTFFEPFSNDAKFRELDIYRGICLTGVVEFFPLGIREVTRERSCDELLPSRICIFFHDSPQSLLIAQNSQDAMYLIARV